MNLHVGEVRQLVISPYRLFYEIKAHRIIVLMLVDGRRNIAELLTQRLQAKRSEV